MPKVALYARYSTDNQSAASIEDQFRTCRDHVGREGWQVVNTYQDAAISGASVILRPGVQSLLQDAQRGKFDIVLAEALDRISRDQADVATLFKHLRFAGVQIVTLAEGEISELHVGLKGTMNALFKDLAAKTHRALRGRVEKGKAGGGLCYGYDVVKRTDSEGEPVRGERKINEAEAVVVRRIFREFATGKSPRAIATDLNRDAIPGPFGHTWGDTTIRGHACRGNGVVNNELYAGLLVWNRQRFIKDPNTGKRVSRPNPEAKWIRTEVPELRIVDDELWQRVKLRQAELAEQFEATIIGVRAARAERLNRLRRPAFLLSGLLTCGCCGGKYGIVVNDRYGCLGHFRKGTCDNGRTVRRDDIERRVLVGLTDKLVSAEAVAVAVRAYAEETNRQNHERRAQAETDRRAPEKIERSIKGIMDAIEDGMYQPAMKARMGELEEQKAEIEARLADAPADLPDVHPNIAEHYRAKVIRLAETLAEPESNGEAREDIRSLVGEVVITPGDKRGESHAILRGELMAILDLAAGRRRSPKPEVITNALAGPGFEPMARRPAELGRPSVPTPLEYHSLD
ncbi:MAG: recombinase family protein [Bradyrhizobium sp.]|jgi:site-specific DNA recombinase|nr:recombinase family protein [Bradyrhizobium sp.]